MERRVDFLFLGETLLIPHLYPAVEALGKLAPDVPQRLWVSTAVHKEMLERWTFEDGLKHVTIHHAPGFRTDLPKISGENPILPAKLPMLARLANQLRRSRVAVCAEQTSLWLPTLLPLKTRFVEIEHGIGGARYAKNMLRRNSAWRVIIASEIEKEAFIARGMPSERMAVTGYLKSNFAHRTQPSSLFGTSKPTILYNPHWQRHRSSWWDWGRQIIQALVGQNRFNVILAPHQRLIEGAPELSQLLMEAAKHDHVHADLRSFAMVDGSYPAAADIYLGDTSSQVVEFMERPRPCVFLNNNASDQQAETNHHFWSCGEVVDEIQKIMPALDRAQAKHEHYKSTQQRFAQAALGNTQGAAVRAAEVILKALG